MNKFNSQPGPYMARFRKQAGSVIITVCLMLLFLLGFMGIAMDFGHLMVVKTELQTAMDSCALAAAQEMDQQPDAAVRARSAGQTAGNLNGVNFQGDQWALTDANITFRDKDYAPTEVDTALRYVECSYTQNGVQMWLLHILGAVENDVPGNPTTRDVFARAVATRGSALTSCPIPVALIPKAGGTAPNYGFTIGEWVKIIDVDNNNNPYPNPGEMGWFNINGTQSAQDTKTQLSAQVGGVCGTAVDQNVELTTNGAKVGVRDQWNFRFGLSKGRTPDLAIDSPDTSGYPYDAGNWPTQFNAFPNFVLKRVENAPHPTAKPWDTITNAQHAQYGYNRRIVTVPVLSPANKVMDFACMFMLQPMFGPTTPVYLEFRGNAGEPSNPCTTNGMAGALAGPLVPVLVR